MAKKLMTFAQAVAWAEKDVDGEGLEPSRLARQYGVPELEAQRAVVAAWRRFPDRHNDTWKRRAALVARRLGSAQARAYAGEQLTQSPFAGLGEMLTA